MFKTLALQEWFNILVVHQNRDNRGRGFKNCVSESMLPNFMVRKVIRILMILKVQLGFVPCEQDLVIWGHEHECLIDPVEALDAEFFVSQPGSSVATSLIEAEVRRYLLRCIDHC